MLSILCILVYGEKERGGESEGGEGGGVRGRERGCSSTGRLPAIFARIWGAEEIGNESEWNLLNSYFAAVACAGPRLFGIEPPASDVLCSAGIIVITPRRRIEPAYPP